MRFHLVCLVFLVCTPTAFAQTVIFVDSRATGSAGGSSWANAFPRLEDAIAAAQPTAEIWVAAGTYHPPSQQSPFELTQEIHVFGGFDGTETAREQRDWLVNVTRLSGDLARDDADPPDFLGAERDENAHTVVMVTAPASSARPTLDGFQISGGHMDVDEGSGAGILISLGSHAALRNLTLSGNYATGAGGGVYSAGTFSLESSVVSGNEAARGGGVFHEPPEAATVARLDAVMLEGNEASVCGGGVAIDAPAGSEPAALVTNTTLRANTSAGNGGGVCLTGGPDTSHSALIGVRFEENVADASGGALFADGAELEAYNVVLAYNEAADQGGGLALLDGADGTVRHATLVGNASPTGAALLVSSASVDIANSILWDNPASSGPAILATQPVSAAISVSIANGGVSTAFHTGDVSSPDPLFIGDGLANPDFLLDPNSPAIDVGANTLVPKDAYDLDGDGIRSELLPFDIDGNPRVIGLAGAEVVDLGAYESEVVGTWVTPPPKPAGSCLVAYPNPAYAHVWLPGGTEVYDILGRRLRVVPGPLLEPVRMELKHLAAGVYLVRAPQGGSCMSTVLVGGF